MGYGGTDIIGIAVAGYHNKYHGPTEYVFMFMWNLWEVFEWML